MAAGDAPGGSARWLGRPRAIAEAAAGVAEGTQQAHRHRVGRRLPFRMPLHAQVEARRRFDREGLDQAVGRAPRRAGPAQPVDALAVPSSPARAFGEDARERAAGLHVHRGKRSRTSPRPTHRRGHQRRGGRAGPRPRAPPGAASRPAPRWLPGSRGRWRTAGCRARGCAGSSAASSRRVRCPAAGGVAHVPAEVAGCTFEGEPVSSTPWRDPAVRRACRHAPPARSAAGHRR